MCNIHGGATKAARAAAERRRAEAAATALLDAIWDPDAAPITDPVAALQALAGRLEHASRVLGARLGVEGVDLDGATGVAWARVLRELRQALVEMERLGLSRREVELQQAQAALVVTAFRAALDAVQLLPMDRGTMTAAFLDTLRAPGVDDLPPVELPQVDEPLSEDLGDGIARVLGRVFDRLELSDRQRELVSVVVPEELRRSARAEVVVGELE